MNAHGLFLYKKRLSTHIKFRGNWIFCILKKTGEPDISH